MKSTFYVDTDKNCNLVIHDNISDYPIKNLDYSDSAVIWYACKVDTNEVQEYISPEPKVTEGYDTVKLRFTDDGYYEIVKLVVVKRKSNSRFVERKDYIRDELIEEYIEKFFESEDGEIIAIANLQGDLRFVNLSEVNENTLQFGERYILREEQLSNQDILDMISQWPYEEETAYNIKESLGETIKANLNVYFYENGKFYMFTSPNDYEEVSVSDIINLSDEEIENTNLYKESKEYFSLCSLLNCYMNICMEIFNKRVGLDKRCSDRNVDSYLIYKRDLVWTALNVIHYLIDSVEDCDNTYAKALDILNTFIEACDICGKYSNAGCGCKKTLEKKGCGCS